MTIRTITAQTAGPLTIDASLLGHDGIIDIRTEASCTQARLTLRTTDETGPAADAVRAATLDSTENGIRAAVEGTGTGGTTVIGGNSTVIRGNRGTTVIQSFGNVTGSVTGIQVGGNFVVSGDVVVNGVRINSGNTTVIQGSEPITIEAVVPEGSSVAVSTDSAAVEATGTYLSTYATTSSGRIRIGTTQKAVLSSSSGAITVDTVNDLNAKTQSGDISLTRTDVVDAKTMSGDISIRDFGGTARLKTMSGSIRVHATAGGDLDAKTMSGDVDVTATQAALDDNLDVRPRSMSGRINVPSRRTGGTRRRSF